MDTSLNPDLNDIFAYIFTKTLGIPAFGVPYANVDESNHAPNENLEVARFFMGIKTGAAMLSYLGGYVVSPSELH